MLRSQLRADLPLSPRVARGHGVSEQYKEDESRGEGGPHLCRGVHSGSRLMEGMRSRPPTPVVFDALSLFLSRKPVESVLAAVFPASFSSDAMLARRTVSGLFGMPRSFRNLFTLREINRNVTHNPTDTLPNREV